MQTNVKCFKPRHIIGTGNLRVTGFILCYDGHPVRYASWSSWMAKWPAKPSSPAIPSSPDRRARDEGSGRDDVGATVASPRVLDRAELPVDTAQLARFLIGKMLVRVLADGVAVGRIVETEAYTIDDAASHAYRGMTPRNRALFLERGHAYVYIAYGTSFMLNVSSETAGVGAGVLIRAIEPVDGIAIMQRNRGVERVRDLARGPGRLCTALDINRQLDGIDLCQPGPLWLGSDPQGAGDIGHSTRIGITRAADSPLRFYVRGNGFVSGPKALNR